MRIAVNAIFLQKDHLEGYGHYANEVLKRMVLAHPEHEFIFLFDRPYDPSFIYASNVKPLIVKPAARHALAFFYWYQISAPSALRKYKVDVWLQPFGFCSLSTSIPQVLIVHDLAFIHYPDQIAWHHRWYYQLFTKSFIQKAKKLVTVSTFSKEDICQQYHFPADKISVIPGAARETFQPLGWVEREQVKEGYADGREYFLFTGGIHPRKNLMNLLKAFSLFKKWQNSNMKLLVAGRLAWKYENLLEKLKTYKYRDDVVLLGYVSEEQLQQLTASAYSLIYPSFFEGFGLPILEAMQSAVPVICSQTSSMPDVGGDAALYADPQNPDDIAKQMLKLYKDESLREEMIKKGLERANEFSWNRSTELLWDQILDATRK